MADTDPSPPPPPPASATSDPPFAPKVHFEQMGERIAQLTESQTDLLVRIQGMKQEVQKWRSTLDTQVKTYKVDIFELKKELNSELNQLRTIKNDSEHAQESERPIAKGSMHKTAAAAEEAPFIVRHY